ncbi:hypothetical protein [Deinococcus aluminii]|uniref:Uncharacterized protein n=1 Tax=Deinococcus aluminii TaxID=1656885 RepID=A0ABP9XF19_9DEIO
MLNDLPLRTAHARDTLTRTFQEMYDVPERQALLLTLSVATALVKLQQSGGPRTTVQGEVYHVGEEPLLPHVLALRPLRGKYLARYAQDPAAAHLLVQQALLARLHPHAGRVGGT